MRAARVDVAVLENKLAQLDIDNSGVDEAQERAIMQLGEDFSRVWHSERCPPELKKRIVRTVIEEIIVDLDDAAQTLSFVIRWKGGTHTKLEMAKPPSAKQHKTAQEDLDIIRAMGVCYGDDEIARVLSKLGRKTGRGKRWSEQRVYPKSSKSCRPKRLAAGRMGRRDLGSSTCATECFP